MPNPKLETYKNKATNTVYDLTDANAQASLTAILDGTSIDSFADVESALTGKVDTVSGKGLSTNDYDNTAKSIVDNIQDNVKANTQLIKDTTGWLGVNKCVNNAVSKTENGVTWTVNTDKSISAYGQPTEGDAYIDVNAGANVSANGVAWICKGCPSGGANNKYYSQLRLSNPNGSWYGARNDTGNGYQLTETEVTANVKIQYRCVIPSNAPEIPQSAPIVFKPMIIDPKQNDIAPAYEPYHESVEEMLTAIKYAAVNASDFTDFQTRMASI